MIHFIIKQYGIIGKSLIKKIMFRQNSSLYWISFFFKYSFNFSYYWLFCFIFCVDIYWNVLHKTARWYLDIDIVANNYVFFLEPLKKDNFDLCNQFIFAVQDSSWESIPGFFRFFMKLMDKRNWVFEYEWL